MTRILELTDGTTTINLIDGVNFALVMNGWSPAVAHLNEAPLGGGFYSDVEEAITINVFAATGAELYTKLRNLNTLLLKARQWFLIGEGTPVRIRYRPENSARAAALEAVVLGHPDGPTVLPSDFHDYLIGREVAEVTVKFYRRGAWLDAEESVTDASPTTSHGITSVAFADTTGLPSPIELRLGTFSLTQVLANNTNNYLFVANTEAAIATLPATGANRTSGSGASSVITDATAINGSVRRHSTTVTGTAFTNIFTVPITFAGRTIGVVLSGRVDVGNWTCTVSIDGVNLISGPIFNETRTTFFAGLLFGSQPAASITVTLTTTIPASQGSVPSQINLDSLHLIALDPTYESALIEFPRQAIAGAIGSPQVIVDPDPLDRYAPLAGVRSTAGDTAGQVFRATHRGNLDVYISGTTVAAMLVITGGLSAYRRRDVTNTTVQSFALTAIRRKAYLTPE